MTIRSLNLACSFQRLCEYCTASIIVSWNSLKLFPTSSQVFWCGL